MPKKVDRDQKGFTMIEVIIVIAIMGILAAILVPSFSAMSRKVKITSDIKGLEQLQRQVHMYYVTYGHYPDKNMISTDLSGADFQLGGTFATNFIEKDYMLQRYFNSQGIRLYTENAIVVWDHEKEKFLLDTTLCDLKITQIVQGMKDISARDAEWLK